jgi:hypothetical protein
VTSPGPAPGAPRVEIAGGGEVTDEELAAILAAHEALWPKPVVLDAGAAPAEPPRWRLSGRWWSNPVAQRRGRPGTG